MEILRLLVDTNEIIPMISKINCNEEMGRDRAVATHSHLLIETYGSYKFDLVCRSPMEAQWIVSRQMLRATHVASIPSNIFCRSAMVTFT